MERNLGEKFKHCNLPWPQFNIFKSEQDLDNCDRKEDYDLFKQEKDDWNDLTEKELQKRTGCVPDCELFHFK